MPCLGLCANDDVKSNLKKYFYDCLMSKLTLQGRQTRRFSFRQRQTRSGVEANARDQQGHCSLGQHSQQVAHQHVERDRSRQMEAVPTRPRVLNRLEWSLNHPRRSQILQ